ncbi:MBL fold metallo-hydrolase [Flavobacterium sp. Arc3]|uniref:MBL fold metallo-hydrolase n=1 Tax=Flavobacterium sp. Arc3 TaxID=3046686 RepID=UPI00352BDEDA
MYFKHIYDKSLSQGSYFIGCQKSGVAAVIDAKRDVDTYIEIAKENNMQITHVLETHIHADFLAGSRELAKVTGAELFLSAEGGEDWQYEFPHNGLKQGDILKLGNLTLEVIHTPGHTPESISFLLTDIPATTKPVMLFTGDFVFVGDVGRPDLLEKAANIVGTANAGALQMYKSIQLFSELGDYIQVWPGHGAGSACGKALGSVPSTTVGYEKIRNWALQYANDRDGFVKYLLEDQPEPPKYFAMMKKLNKVDRPLLTEVPTQKLLAASALKTAIEKGVKVIDARNKLAFAAGFIPQTLNIQGNNSFATWAGWFVDYDEKFILVVENESQVDDLTRKLMRIGLDNVMGYVVGTKSWTDYGGKLETAKNIDLHKFKEVMDDSVIIDVRGASEFNTAHIKEAQNVFVGTIYDHLNLIPKDKQVVIHCQGGDRSAIAYSILAKEGYTKIANYSAGMNEWVKDNPTISHEK